MSDLDLPDALRDEMRAAWHRYLDLVTPIRGDLHRYCRRLTRNVWDAEDLAQEALLRAFGGLARLHDPLRNPRAYLLRIATHAWIDQLRKRERESDALAEHGEAEPTRPAAGGAVRDAASTLLHRLPPQERAAVILKDVFDLSLEESAEVLDTTIGAVKAALHRGRGRLREPEKPEADGRPRPSRKLVDRFVDLYNAGDKAGLIALVLENAAVENIPIGIEWGDDAHRSPNSWFEGSFGGHERWPAEWQYEAQRAEAAELDGEPIVLVYRTRRGREKMETIVRIEEREDRVSRIRSYSFCPETIREVGERLGVTVRTGPYRYPTPSPGADYRDEE